MKVETCLRIFADWKGVHQVTQLDAIGLGLTVMEKARSERVQRRLLAVLRQTRLMLNQGSSTHLLLPKRAEVNERYHCCGIGDATGTATCNRNGYLESGAQGRTLGATRA